MKLVFIVTVFVILPFPAFAQDSTNCSGSYKDRVAIFIDPTDREIEEMKKSYGDDFYTIADDRIYYRWQAAEFFRKNSFPYCFTEIKEHTFKMVDGKEKVVDSGCKDWCMILWNRDTDPIVTDAIDLFFHYEYLGFPPVIME